MENLFLTVLSMSGTGAVIILLVLLARLLLRKAPKVFSYALWAVVLLRLLCPLSIPTPWSLTPIVQVKSAGEYEDMVQLQFSQMELVIAVEGAAAARPEAPAAYPVAPAVSASPSNTGGAEPGIPAGTAPRALSPWSIAAAVWAGGAALLLGYSVASLLRLRRRLVGSAPLEGEKNVRLADHIPSPFVLGLARPRIYLPSDLPEGERDYILLHERTHIRRGDHVFRALAWLALSIHWFNPLVWLAFHLAGKDMEMSCDEAVLRKMGRDVRADYSTSLLRLSQGGRLPAGPLAFGGGDPQGRIKNILRYQKPALWVTALALAVVTCTGAALATSRSTVFIDPDRVASVTMIDAASSTDTPDHGTVYTAADRRQDLSGPAQGYALSGKDAAGLVDLLNRYRRSVYTRGEPEELSGDEHHLCRIDCEDGSFYVVDFWYWNGFSIHPLHFGEDSYTTLVTYYDAQGRAETTWQMEYGFDRAYQDWRGGVGGEALPAGLSCSLNQKGDGVPCVRFSGALEGIAQDQAIWFPPAWYEEFGEESLGRLWFEMPLCGDETAYTLDACWTDESRSAVLVTATPQAMISSYSQAGNLSITVFQPEGEGRLVELSGYIPKLSAGAPELVPTEEEAVRAARIAAKLLVAAEDYYNNALPGGAPGPVYELSDTGDRVSIRGVGDAYLEWGRSAHGKGSLYFAEDPAYYCPRLAGKLVEGGAHYEDETTLSVTFNVNDERVRDGTVSGFRVDFAVDLDRGVVVEKDFRSMVEGETLELTDREMADMAQILAELIEGAWACWQGGRGEAPSQPFVLTPLGVSYALNETGDGVYFTGPDCAGAAWYPRDVALSGRLGLPERGGALGYLSVENPRFLGGYFANAYGNAIVLYYPEEDGPLLAVGFDDYTASVYDTPSMIFFTVDLAAKQVKSLEISGYPGRAPEFSDTELVTMAGRLAGMIEGASDYYAGASNPPPETGPLPFDQPLRLWFGSGAGAWRTVMVLHADGSFEGKYNDSDMGVTGEGYPLGTEYVCDFHGRFGDIAQLTPASWSLTLEELTLDTGHPIGEEWIAERRKYISSAPYGLTGEDGPLESGARFVLYTPEASAKPGGELYGMENESSELFPFWIWWPERPAAGGVGDGVLGCYGLRNVETGYGFFDLSAWGIAPEQPRG